MGEESGKRAEGKEKVRGGINISGKVDLYRGKRRALTASVYEGLVFNNGETRVNGYSAQGKKKEAYSPLGPVESVTVSPSVGGGGVGPGFSGCSCVIHCQALLGATGKFQFTSSSVGAGLGWKSRSNHEARPCTREVRETIKSMGMVNSRRSSLEQV